MTDMQEKPSGGFDFCFWAKLLVAIPVLPLVATLAAMRFTTPMSQALAAVAAVIALKIDKMPLPFALWSLKSG